MALCGRSRLFYTIRQWLKPGCWRPSAPATTGKRWPRNAYSRDLAGRLLKMHGKGPAATEKTLDAIAARFEGSPLEQIKAAGN
ncbi:MAG: hypothetical protein ACYC2I_13645 [Elusimicrobiales bacterium]